MPYRPIRPIAFSIIIFGVTCAGAAASDKEEPLDAAIQSIIKKKSKAEQDLKSYSEKLKKLQALRNGKTRGLNAYQQPEFLQPYTDAARAAHCSPLDTPCIFAANDVGFNHAVYLRRDKLDAFYYLYPNYPDFASAKGASIDLLKDDQAHTFSTSVHAFSSYVFRHEFDDLSVRDKDTGVHVSSVAAAPFISLDGKVQEPFKNTERSAAQVGLDAQAELYGGGPFSLQNLDLSPYFQTDFRGRGVIYGAQGLWEPYQPDWHLGATADLSLPKYVGYFFRTVGEADVIKVDNAGLSDFRNGQTYGFVGGTGQIRTVLFQNMPEVGSLFCGRIHVDGGVSYFYDPFGHKPIHQVQAEARYDLSPGTTPYNVACVSDGAVARKEPVTAVAFTYTNGTDKQTREFSHTYELSLTLEY